MYGLAMPTNFWLSLTSLKPSSHLPYDVHVPALYRIGQTEPEPLHVLEAPHAQAIQLLMNS